MALPTQPLRDEHRELLPHLETLREAADALGDEVDPRQAIDAASEFLNHHLLVHAKAEEAALYPEVDRLMGSGRATGTMRLDHAAVARLTTELDGLRAGLTDGPPGPQQVRDLRRVLYGLYTLVAVHFEKEEQVYLPILDEGLNDAEATALFERLEAAASEARQRS